MPVKFSVGLPNAREGRQHPIGSVSPDASVRMARLAEELGFYSLWPNEFFITYYTIAAKFPDPPQLYDTVVTMAYAAAATKRIRITPSTIILPLHEPLLLSRQIATLDVFSGGRITLGIGLGGSGDEFRQMFGHLEKPHRGKMLEEYLQALRVLWRDRKASFEGKYARFHDVESYPKPIQDPLPIFMAGHTEGVFARIVKYGQGWINSSALPDTLRAEIAELRHLWNEAGRGDEPLEVARQLVVSIAPTDEEAKAIYRASTQPPAAPQTTAKPEPQKAQSAPAAPKAPEERTWMGTPAALVRRLEKYVDAGATEIALIFCWPDLETGERQMRLFAEEVMPAFASLSAV